MERAKSLRARVAALALAASLGQGCFALDLLDESEKEMDALTQHGAAPAARQAAAAPTGGEKKPDPSKEWWGRARSLVPGDTDAGIVRCELRGGVQFTRRTDCLARGGRPASPQG